MGINSKIQENEMISEVYGTIKFSLLVICQDFLY
jgi:hypothetical protein